MIEPKHPGLSVTQQCDLLGLPRSSYYYVLAPEPTENLRLMRVIDETYLAHPFFGSRQMTRWRRRQSHDVNKVAPENRSGGILKSKPSRERSIPQKTTSAFSRIESESRAQSAGRDRAGACDYPQGTRSPRARRR
jgi:hypothetical protein